MNIYNWDVVYASSINSINKKLKQSMENDKVTFNYKDENTYATLTFRPWEILEGGSGKLLRIKVFVEHGELEYFGIKTKLDGICPLLEVQLNFFNDRNNFNVKNLEFNFKLKGDSSGDKRDGAVTIVDIDLNNKFKPNSIIYTILSLILSDMFIDNKSKISFIFAKLNFGSNIKWMKPQNYIYSYYSPTNGNNKGLLAVYSVVTNRDISKLTTNIDGKIIDNSNDTFLVISEKLFLENIIIPELPKSFGSGSTSKNFRFIPTSETHGYIENNGHINCRKIRWGLTDYYPKLTSLIIKIQGNKLYMKAYGRCDITGLADSYITFDIETKNTFYFDNTNKKIKFIIDNNPTLNFTRHIPWWIWLVSAIVSPIVDLIVHTITNDIANNIARSIVLDTNSYIGNLTTEVLEWNGMRKSNVTDCILDVAFAIKGKVTN